MPYALTTRSAEFDEEFKSATGYCDWLFNDRFFPEGLLPASFSANGATIGTNIITDPGRGWRNFLKIAPPDDRFTSTYFGVYHPDALHDFLFRIKSLDLNTHLKQSARITSYSLPMPARESERERVRGVSDYLKLEEDITADSWDFSTLIKLDVKHCYPSIYSHSLHWVIDGYENVRSEDPVSLAVTGVNKGGTGHVIDNGVLAMHGGITKGIAVGPGSSDLIAELLLRKIDEEISDCLIAMGIDAIGGRYKDDYRILVKDERDAQRVIDLVGEKLAKYLLHLNEEKTCKGQPFDILQRTWMVDYHAVMNQRPKTLKQFLWHLAYVADLQSKYPGKRLLAKYLSEPKYTPKNASELRQITSVLLSMADVYRSTVPFAVSFIEVSSKNFGMNEANQILLDKLAREQNPYNALWYLHFLATYKPEYQTLLEQKIKAEAITGNRFWESLYYQEDRLFTDKKVGATFFHPVKDKTIFEQTRMFADLY